MKESGPEKPVVGVYVYVPFVAIEMVPCEGLVCPVTVRPVPMSVAKTVVPLSAVLADVRPESFTAVGVTVRDTVDVAVWPVASVLV